MANGFQPGFEGVKHLILGQIGKLFAEAFQVAKRVFINEADQAKQFEQGILQGRGGQQELVFVCQSHFQRVGDDIGRLVNVAQPVGFIHDDEIPRRVGYIRGFVAGELVGANDNGIIGLKRAEIANFDSGIIRLGFKQPAGQEKFFIQFLIPLFPQIGGRDDKNAAFAFGPFL